MGYVPRGSVCVKDSTDIGAPVTFQVTDICNIIVNENSGDGNGNDKYNFINKKKNLS